MNPVTRFIRSIVAPETVMSGLVEQPVWLAPLLTVAIVSALCGTLLVTAFDFDAMAKDARERQIQQLPAAQKRVLDNFSDEQKEAQEKIQGYVMQAVKVFKVIGPFLGVPILVLIIAGVLYFLVNLQGTEADFKLLFAMVAHTCYVHAVASVVTVLLIGLTGRLDPLLSVALVLDEEAAGGVAFHLLNRLNVFHLWQLGVIITGLRRVTHLSSRRAAATVFGPWLLWSVLIVALGLIPRLAG